MNRSIADLGPQPWPQDRLLKGNGSHRTVGEASRSPG